MSTVCNPCARGEGQMDLVAVVVNALNVLLGIPGNCAVIWVAGFKLKASIFNVWLVNLAVADLVFCVTRILALVNVLLSDQWVFGPWVCKLGAFFKYANMFCGVFILAVISADRAACVCFPVLSRRHRTLAASRALAAATWAAGLGFSVPFAAGRHFFRCAGNLNRCSGCECHFRTALYWLRFLCGFLLPFLVVAVCSTLAGVGLLRTRLSGKRRTLRILALLAGAFFLSWAPYHVLLMVRMADGDNRLVARFLPAAKGLAFFNSCLNPLLYFSLGFKPNDGKSPSGRSAPAGDAGRNAVCGQIGEGGGKPEEGLDLDRLPRDRTTDGRTGDEKGGAAVVRAKKMVKPFCWKNKWTNCTMFPSNPY
ncbi:C3a anaphylatoxin chemotactic receptor-like [Stigmatopora argus]